MQWSGQHAKMLCAQDNHNFRGKNQFRGHKEKEIKQQGTSYVFYVWFYASFMTALWLSAKFCCVCVQERATRERIKLYPFADEKNLLQV